MIIKTNNQTRPILSYYDLTKKEIKELDSVYDDSEFFIRYKGNIYAMSDFMKYDIEGYHGIYNHTAFNGVLIKLTEDTDYVKMASYYN